MKFHLQPAIWCCASLLALAPGTGFAQTVSTPTAAPASGSASAAAAGLTYDFLTVTASESGSEDLATVLFAPPFQGKSQVQLEQINGIFNVKNRERLQRNTVLINQQLTNLTAAGWELFQVYPLTLVPDVPTTRYLFRKARR